MKPIRKALIISPNFYPAIGGAETQALVIARALNKRGFKMTIITRRYFSNSPREENFKKLKVFRFTTFLELFVYLLRFSKNSIIIWNGLLNRNSESITLLQAIYVYLSKILSQRVILRIPCVTSPFFENRLTGSLFRKGVDKWFPISLWQEKELKRQGVKTASIIMAPNLIIDRRRFCPAKKIVKKTTIIYYGRAVKSKGLKILVEAINKIKSPANFRLLLLLSVPTKYAEESREVLTYLNKINCPFEIMFEITNVEKYLKQFTIGIFPSSFEGGGNILREMMACGLAVIASNLPACKEIVNNNVNGLLFKKNSPGDLANKLNYLLENLTITKKLGLNARQTIKNLCDEKTIVSKILN